MPKTCKAKAGEYVSLTATTGAAIAMVPVPGMGTVGLLTIETGLIYWVARIYGERLTKEDIATLAATLGVTSVAIKFGVMEVLNLVPIAGWMLKVPLAASVVKSIGELAVKHFEDKYPGKLYVVDPDVEQQRRSAT